MRLFGFVILHLGIERFLSRPTGDVCLILSLAVPYRHDDFDFVALRTLLYPPRSQGGTSLITLAKYL